MHNRYRIIPILLLLTGTLSAQTPSYQETFPEGEATLQWLSFDGFSQLAIDTAFGNPSEDSTVGYVKGVADFGGTGNIFAGSPNLTDYKVEAQIYAMRNAPSTSGTNNGIYGRVKIIGQSYSAYALSTDYDSNNRLRLRKFEADAEIGTPSAVIRDWEGTEIPGGIPSESSWHKLALEFSGDQINAYYDDQLLPGSPFTDAESDSGYFGIYCFVGFSTAAGDSATFFDDVEVTDLTTSVAGEPGSVLPGSFSLLANYPNPFNPATTIVYELQRPAEILLEVFNLRGQRVAKLFKGQQAVGKHELSWDAVGKPSGNYLVRLKAGSVTSSRQIMLIK